MFLVFLLVVGTGSFLGSCTCRGRWFSLILAFLPSCRCMNSLLQNTEHASYTCVYMYIYTDMQTRFAYEYMYMYIHVYWMQTKPFPINMHAQIGDKTFTFNWNIPLLRKYSEYVHVNVRTDLKTNLYIKWFDCIRSHFVMEPSISPLNISKGTFVAGKRYVWCTLHASET